MQVPRLSCRGLWNVVYCGLADIVPWPTSSRLVNIFINQLSIDILYICAIIPFFLFIDKVYVCMLVCLWMCWIQLFRYQRTSLFSWSNRFLLIKTHSIQINMKRNHWWFQMEISISYKIFRRKKSNKCSL